MNLHKALILVISAAALIFLSGISLIVNVSEKNGVYFVSEFNYSEEDFSNPRLRLLRKREKLDEVIAPGKTQLEKLVLLRNWTNRQWKNRGAFYYPAWDAVEILDLARGKKNYGFCAQYAIVYLQACQSLGLHARYAGIAGHIFTEAWSDEYDKWVVMDPNNDIHYEKNGLPLSGMEVYDAYKGKNIRGLQSVGAAGSRKNMTLAELSGFIEFNISLRCNHLAEPVEIICNGKKQALKKRPDYTAYPLMGRDRVIIDCTSLLWGATYAAGLEKLYSKDADDFNYHKNQTVMSIVGKDPKRMRLKVHLESANSPTFRTFLVKIGNGDWRESPENLIYYLKPGFNRFYARVLTGYGWQGPESRLLIFCKPGWF